ncbi:MAG: DUF2793 domain-containing protein [Natronohydrobacter sp.]|nr:DUF2793 domain-containing protein [Natronohydrobacter sp.]
MPDSSARLSLPFLLPAQAQKHVTHNEALERLDLLVQLTVEGFGATTPPALPEDGRVWALGPAPTGDWDGQGARLAARVTGGWVFLSPQPGWLAAQGSDLRIWDGADWVIPDQPVLETLPGLGINTGFDLINRLAVASDATLLTHDGQGHQLKINKATASATASLLFQTGWAGRAEMGTTGSDTFEIKVSADGAVWHTALSAAPATGRASFPGGATVSGSLTGTAVTQSATDTTAGRLTKIGDFGIGGNAVLLGSGADLNTLTATGFYCWTNSNPPANAPQSAFGQLLHMQRSEASRSQLVLQSAGNQRVWVRGFTGGAWGVWHEIFHSNSILGTVSQSAGVPTGAILQRGSNANGEFIRFADGTQICTNGNAPVTTDPAAFAGTVTSIDGDKLRLGRWF